MKKAAIGVVILMVSVVRLYAQELYYTDNGHVDFYSSAPVEDIKADNNRVTSFLKTNGDLVFAIPIRSFEFEKSLMKEHFNEKYMHTDKYPKANFKGRIINVDEVDFSKDGIYDATVEGDMTIHGITKPYKVEGTLEVKGEQIIAKAKFPVAVKDHDIEIPKLLVKNIAEVVEVTVDITYTPHTKSSSN
ncbi:MAG: YceI family protein [Bacteroidia bacterium]